jgi:hypothetical protein
VPRRSEKQVDPSARNPGTRSGAQRAWTRAALAALVTACGFWSARAAAQDSTSTITIGKNVGRRLPDAEVGSEYPYRNARRWWINYNECLRNEYFDFYITVTNPMYRLEVWAGTENCSERRALQDHGQCWIVGDDNSGSFNVTISVPVRRIVSNNVGIDSGTLRDPESELGTDVCNQSMDASGVQLSLYFFLQNGGQVVGTAQTWDPTNLGGVGYDMIGPAPPRSIHTGMGENQLTVNLDDVQTDADRERFAAYCAPAVADDGTFVPSEDAPPTCFTDQLMPGARPDSALKCGEANETSNVITTDTNLANDQLYAVGVSGEDIIGNAGPLSTLACGIPKQLNDFFELYAAAGGPGGGGFCSVSTPASSRSKAPTLAVFAALFAGLALRRGRNRP